MVLFSCFFVVFFLIGDFLNIFIKSVQKMLSNISNLHSIFVEYSSLLIICFGIWEYQSYIIGKTFFALIDPLSNVVLYCLEIHWALYDLIIVRHFFNLDWRFEGPWVLMTQQLLYNSAAYLFKGLILLALEYLLKFLQCKSRFLNSWNQHGVNVSIYFLFLF